jgi:hypothetical protein
MNCMNTTPVEIWDLVNKIYFVCRFLN